MAGWLANGWRDNLVFNGKGLVMAMLKCDCCNSAIDTDYDDFTTQHGKVYCDDCYNESPEHCEDAFEQGSGECLCGMHKVCRAQPDVGFMQDYLEFR